MKAGALLMAILLAFAILWKCSLGPTGNMVDASTAEGDSIAATNDSLLEEWQGSKNDLERSVISNGVSEDLLNRIRSDFAAIYPSRYAEGLDSFLQNQEERLSALVNLGEPLPLDRFLRSQQHLLGQVPLRHRDELESCNLFQMDHLQLLLTGQNRSFILFGNQSPEHWLQFPIEKLEKDPFQYPPDVIYAYLTGNPLSNPELIEKMADIRANTLLALADHHQRWWLADRIAEGILQLDYGLDNHTPGYDAAVKLALEQVGMAQSLQEEEDMIMHRYLNQIRYEAQLANPDIVVR